MSKEKAIDNFLSEHFKTYILVAYDYDGNNINYSNIKNQEECDAIMTALERTCNDFNSGIGDEENNIDWREIDDE